MLSQITSIVTTQPIKLDLNALMWLEVMRSGTIRLVATLTGVRFIPIIARTGAICGMSVPVLAM